jgi:hypothetical protein
MITQANQAKLTQESADTTLSINSKKLVHKRSVLPMRMTLILVPSIVAALAQGTMAGTREMIGLSEQRLFSCAGLPEGQIISRGLTYYEYAAYPDSASNDRQSWAASTSRLAHCRAVVIVKNGVVVKVSYKTGGRVKGIVACHRLFSDCR